MLNFVQLRMSKYRLSQITSSQNFSYRWFARSAMATNAGEKVSARMESVQAQLGDKAHIAFKLFDKDKDGFVTKSEMEKRSRNLSKDQIEKV